MIIGRLNLDTLILDEGSHEPDATAWGDNDCYTGAVCLMEACSAATEQFPVEDLPKCTAPTLSRIGIALNDADWEAYEDRTKALAPLIPLLIKTSGWYGDALRDVLEALADALVEHAQWERPPYWTDTAPLSTLSDIIRDAIHGAVNEIRHRNAFSFEQSTAFLNRMAEAFGKALQQ